VTAGLRRRGRVVQSHALADTIVRYVAANEPLLEDRQGWTSSRPVARIVLPDLAPRVAGFWDPMNSHSCWAIVGLSLTGQRIRFWS
jgi:hypothetical protein